MGSSTNGRSLRSRRRRRGSSPRLPNRPTVPEVIPMVKRLYEMEGCSLGGPLHHVFEDGNYQNQHLAWTVAHNPDLFTWGPEAARLGCEIAAKMLLMTGTQRRKIVGASYYPW